MINDPIGPQAATRQPRLRVLYATGSALPPGAQVGADLAGAISASVTQSSYYHADTFSLSFATSAGPAGWWDTDPPLLLDVRLSIDNGESWQSLIIGEVDHLTANIQTGTLQMDGRDLSARLIEAKTQESFVNQTASEVVKTLAARHADSGMTADATPTKTLVRRYYEADHTTLTLDQFSRTTTEWDLLVYLAQREGFDVYMKGTTLHFHPITPPDANPFGLVWTAPEPVPRFNAVTLRMERSLTIAKDVQVDVRSWSSQQARAFTKSAKAIGGKSASAAGGGKKASTTQKYVFVRPNLTEDAAQKMANQLAIDITKHERVIDVELPGELILTPRNMVKLLGTATSFDQTYFVDTITRSLSFDEGFRENIRMKNSSPRTQTQL